MDHVNHKNEQSLNIFAKGKRIKMLKWIKVRQDSSSTISKSNDETDVEPVKEEEDDSGMEREDSPAIDLSLLKKVHPLIFLS